LLLVNSLTFPHFIYIYYHCINLICRKVDSIPQKAAGGGTKDENYENGGVIRPGGNVGGMFPAGRRGRLERGSEE
jgi:hypothetical protein